jgi:uncharacterized protein
MSTTPVSELPPTVIVRPALEQKQQVANYWHTVAVVAILLLVSFAGANRQGRAAGSLGRPGFYLSAITLEWVLVGVVYLGIKRRGYRLRDLIGGRWRGFDDVLLELAIAAGFWVGAAVVLAALAYALGLAGRAEEMRRSLEFLIPRTPLDFALWLAVSVTAGFCEEVIYRGYLQRQLAAVSRSVTIGVVVSAIVFGASHAYEGGARMIIIGVFGALFGILAALRKSLRPGMIAHAWHDAFSGVMLGILRRG